MTPVADVPPTVTTQAASGVTAATAVGHGNITSLGFQPDAARCVLGHQPSAHHRGQPDLRGPGVGNRCVHVEHDGSFAEHDLLRAGLRHEHGRYVLRQREHLLYHPAAGAPGEHPGGERGRDHHGHRQRHC